MYIHMIASEWAFEWDPAKAAANLAKHGISFVTAARVLGRGTAFSYRSDRSSEARWVAVDADPMTGRIIAVVYTDRGNAYRIISARRARSDEKKAYWQRRGEARAR